MIMELKELITKDYMTAMREKNTIAKNLLSVIKGEIQTFEKNPNFNGVLSDEDIIKILNKTLKSIKETIEISGSEDSKIELSIVESYLPKQMSREEIVEKVILLKNTGITNIGLIMKEFASLPVDRKLVSEVIKEII